MAARVEFVEERRWLGLAQGDSDLRELVAGAVEQQWEKSGDRGGEGADDDRAADTFVPRVEFMAGAFDLGEDGVGVGEQRVPSRREHDTPPDVPQHLEADVVGDPAQLL